MTVLVSSDTDIYISPGLYGDCLPTVATVGAADSFRAGHFFRLFLHARTPAPKRTATPVGPERRIRDSRHIDVMTIVKVT
ncbi:hypothetical protein GCM10022232_35410 [Streptomyces plumbiresistens]|uniref:Uncharacterized protein n=1 Tax=Streptomyces plumbiresistens TaxID=511811 RepID=A0ABP7RD88_9ACTN